MACWIPNSIRSSIKVTMFAPGACAKTGRLPEGSALMKSYMHEASQDTLVTPTRPNNLSGEQSILPKGQLQYCLPPIAS